jgi:hypothetical protein
MADTLSLALLIKPSEFGMRALATLLLDHLKGTQIQSLQLHSPLMENALSLAPMIKLSVFGMHTLAVPLQDHLVSVAFSPDGIHIVSGSFDQTIQVWDAHTSSAVTEPSESTVISVNDSPLSYHVPSDILSTGQFKFQQDGWIISHNVPFFWVSPQFHTQMPYPCNTLVIGPHGATFIDYHPLFIGKTWSNCYLQS